MSVAEAISNRIKHMPKGKPFAGAMFADAGPRTSVDKALSRLVQAGSLERIKRGVYMRPKVSSFIGKVRPNPQAVMEVITKTNGETIQIHGAEAVRRMGLSTQMQVLPTFYTSGTTREIKVDNAVIRLRHACNNRLQHAGTTVGVALTALHYVGKQNLSAEVVAQVAKTLSSEELVTLRASKMPEWMRSALSLTAQEIECQPPTSICPPTNNVSS